MSKKDKIIDVLNNLLQGENMAVDAFNIFINKAQDENIKKTFQEIQNQHRENMGVISNYIQDLGYKPKEKLGIKGVMSDFMISIDLTGKDDSQTLSKAISGEDKGINMVEEIMKIDLDDESKRLVNQILEEDRSSLAKLRRIGQ
ncbi:DUF2383 domain-containing protein [Wukongibacter sp. M2B1]|uniref:DUF2383 domain-containing protein n=1 Tax=Wukongibacter sp. M2B1 TaxID=3088895 RepID=UPI003D78B6ED